MYTYSRNPGGDRERTASPLRPAPARSIYYEDFGPVEPWLSDTPKAVAAEGSPGGPQARPDKDGGEGSVGAQGSSFGEGAAVLDGEPGVSTEGGAAIGLASGQADSPSGRQAALFIDANEAKRGILLAEILGPPVSRKRRTTY